MMTMMWMMMMMIDLCYWVSATT